MIGRKKALVACGALALLVAGVFADVLFVPGDRVASFSPYGDVRQYYYASRTFAFGELASGRVPVWNPHIFSGTPCLANFQTAIFYPPNLVYLVLPMAKAISFDLAFHILLFGLLTFAWARNRGQCATAAFVSGVVAMFSGALMLHVYGGHLTMVAAFAYMPLILLVVDKVMSGAGAWAMVGAVAVTLQILAGLPHVVFMTFVTVGLYFLLQLPSLRRPFQTLSLFALVGVLPLLVTGVQLYPALHFLRLCAPHGDGSLDFATTFSFPPENLLMLLAPGFWGGFGGVPYAGRWQVWEVSFFIGLGGLFLVAMPLFRGRIRKNLPLYGVAAVMIVLALGRCTPLYGLLFNYVTGFSLFRAPARLLVPASLMLAVLAGEGMQGLLDRPLKSLVPAVAFGALAAALAAGALYVHAQASLSPRETTLVRLMEYLTSTPLKKSELASAVGNVRFELIRAACVAAVFGAVLGLVKRFPRAAWLVAVAVAAEMALFAFPAKSSFHLSEIGVPAISEAHKRIAPNRLLDDPSKINRVWNSGGYDVWGSDPLLQSRYAEFVVGVMGVRYSTAWSGNPNFLAGGEITPAMGVLRLGGLADKRGDVSKPPPWVSPLPAFSLITDVTVKPKDEVLAAVKSSGFRPATQLVLEEAPDPAPDATSRGGTGAIVEQGAAYYVVDVEVPGPAVLLNTDAYAPGWIAKGVGESSGVEYKVLPADYAVRAIPLAAGKHRIRLEYVPPLLREGQVVSLWAAGVVVVAGVFRLRRRDRIKSPPTDHR